MRSVRRATTLIGDRVRNEEGKRLGRVEEIMVDLDRARIAYVVIAGGGFLGLGEKLFAIPWEAVTVNSEHRELIVPLAKEVLQTAPGFDRDNWPDFTDSELAVLVHRHYGVEPEM